MLSLKEIMEQKGHCLLQVNDSCDYVSAVEITWGEDLPEDKRLYKIVAHIPDKLGLEKQPEIKRVTGIDNLINYFNL